MLWQDWVLTAGSALFAFALLPSVLGKDKPAVSTSFMTGTVLLIFAFVYWTLSLWISTITTVITAILWLTLAIQKILTNKK